jgi:hypothetical protein
MGKRKSEYTLSREMFRDVIVIVLFLIALFVLASYMEFI